MLDFIYFSFIMKNQFSCLNYGHLFFFAVCPDGWFMHSLTKDGTTSYSCLIVHASLHTFDDAKTACDDSSAILYEPKTQEENENIFRISQEIFDEAEYWIGILLDTTNPDSGT